MGVSFVSLTENLEKRKGLVSRPSLQVCRGSHGPLWQLCRQWPPAVFRETKPLVRVMNGKQCTQSLDGSHNRVVMPKSWGLSLGGTSVGSLRIGTPIHVSPSHGPGSPLQRPLGVQHLTVVRRQDLGVA